MNECESDVRSVRRESRLSRKWYCECEYDCGNLSDTDVWIREVLIEVHAEVYTRISDWAVDLHYRARTQWCARRCGG